MNKTSSNRMTVGWGDNAPSWVQAMATRCDETSQNRVSKELGISGTMVSLALANTYPGDMVKLETIVRGAFLNETVECPILGPLRKNDCLKNQDREFSTANNVKMRLYRACRNGCVNSRLSLGENQ